MTIADLLTENIKSYLKDVKRTITIAADKAGDIAGFIGEKLTGRPAKEIDKEIENSVETFLDNAGYCISDVHIHDIVKGGLNNTSYAVSELKLDELVEDGIEDIYDFVDDIDEFVQEKHLPPTPCCFVLSCLRDKIDI